MTNIRLKETNYTPSFEGRHNAVKVKVWLILYDAKLGGKPDKTLRELNTLTGCDYKSLSTLLTRWIKWKYVGFHNYPGGRKYYLLKRGVDWLLRWDDTMPIQRYISEIEQHQKILKRKEDRNAT